MCVLSGGSLADYRRRRNSSPHRLNCGSCQYLLSTCRNLLSLRLLIEPSVGERTQFHLQLFCDFGKKNWSHPGAMLTLTVTVQLFSDSVASPAAPSTLILEELAWPTRRRNLPILSSGKPAAIVYYKVFPPTTQLMLWKFGS